MKIHLLVLVVIATLPGTSLHAQVEVRSASYGLPKPAKSIDVRKLLQQRFDSGSYQFRLQPSVFGVDPNPGRQNLLAVEYMTGGKKGYAGAKDGQIFTLPGFAAPRSPSGVPLRFESSYSRILYVYELDKWGAWQWKAQLDPGSVYSARGQAGDNWVVTDRNGRIVRQVRVTSNMAPIQLR